MFTFLTINPELAFYDSGRPGSKAFHKRQAEEKGGEAHTLGKVLLHYSSPTVPFWY